MKLKRRDDDLGRRSFVDVLFSPIRAIQDWFADALSGSDAMHDGQSSSVVSFLTFPLRLLWGFAVFMVQAWTTSRNGMAFIRGMPALGILAFTPFLVWVLNNYERKISVNPTIGYHDMHRRNGNYDDAALFSEKLVELEPQKLEFKFFHAQNLAQIGKVGEATRIMQHLAGDTLIKNTVATNAEDVSSDQQNDSAESETEDSNETAEPEQLGRAHVWLSQRLLREQRIEFSEERNQKAMDHLRAAIALEPDNMQAKISLVELYSSRAEKLKDEDPEGYRENLTLARKELEQLTSYERFFRIEQIVAMPQLIDICVKLGDQAAAERTLGRATSKVSRVARLNPEFFEIWLSLVQCAVAVKDYDKAQEFIQEGYRSVKNPENRRRIMQLASLISLQNADDFLDLEVEQQFRLRLFALCKAIQANPRDIRIYQRLMDYVDVDKGGPIRDAWLRNSILGCPIPGVIHIILGMRELSRDNIVQGQSHWDIAQQQFGTTEFVVHRLISIAVQKDEKYVKGQIISKAIEMFPEQYMLYETRGALKKENGLFKDALEDFKIVESKVPELITVHKHLADCYEEIGRTEMAQIHRDRVEEILDKLEHSERTLYEQALDRL